MSILDPYCSVGYALELLAHSPYHSQLEVGPYFDIEIMPPLERNQVRFYISEEGVPNGMVTWAWLSKEVELEVHQTGRALSADEWLCGDRLFFNDWIAPFGGSRKIAHDLVNNIFPNHTASSLRRNKDGSVRKVNRWLGAKAKNWKKIDQAETFSRPPRQIHENFICASSYPGLVELVSNWKTIKREMEELNFSLLPIDRDGKTHADVASEVETHIRAGGAYGWLQGWGAEDKRKMWTQLGLVIADTPVPYLGGHMGGTLALLSGISGVKVAALLRMQPGGLLEAHTHPELAEEGLLQMHLTLEAAIDQNFAYLNVNGEFRQHIPGEAFVFDGSKPHFAVNASPQDRTILYLEFDPALVDDRSVALNRPLEMA